VATNGWNKVGSLLCSLKQNAAVPEPSMQRVWAVFDAALQIPPNVRQNFVAAQCGEDATLLNEVLELLEYHSTVESSDSFRASQSGGSTASTAGDELGDFPGTSRYVVQRRLGSGGLGVVYQVRDLIRGSTIALKTLRNFTVESLFRFKREFRALADVAHPNLVQLYELGYDQRRWFFTMELVDGQRFLHHVWYGSRAIDAVNRLSRPLSQSSVNDQAVLTRLRTAAGQLVEGLDALHQSGHLHRDIKPSNVLVSTSGRVVLVDFGLALEVGRAATQQSMTIAGTPAYMSPEQAAGLPLSSASDLYSVGVMLYEALTGTIPHDGEFLEILIRKQQVDAQPPSATVSGVPTALDELCTALLRRDPAAPPTTQGVQDCLGW
jgi:serine/threonine protein kinase